MTLLEKYQKVQELGVDTDLPFAVYRVLGVKQMSIMGQQVCIGSQDCDYVSISEAREALQLMAEQLGGVIQWDKTTKKKS
jgi:hypothetical protein